MAVITLAWMTLAHFQNLADEQQLQARRVARVARALAWTYEQEGLREDDAAEGQTQRLAAAAVAKVPGLERALILRKTTFKVHSDEALAGERLDRESTADKVLYDTAKRIKSDVRNNREEREKRPELTRNPFNEIDVEAPEGGPLTVSVPVFDEGDFDAMAQVVAAPVELDGPAPLNLLLAAAIALILGLLIGRLITGPPLLLAGSGLVLCFTVYGVISLAGWRSDLRMYHAEVEAQTFAALDEGGLLAASAPDQQGTLAPMITRDSFGEARGDLLALGQAPEPTDSTAGVAVKAGDFTLTVSHQWLDARYNTDLDHLSKWAAGFGLLGMLIFLLGAVGRIDRAGRSLYTHRTAYAYLSPAMMGMLILVFVPVVYGIVLGFQTRQYNSFTFAGLDNYLQILSDFNYSDPRNFYFKLGVTILWTVSNVVLHVGIGLTLALMLNDEMLKAKGIFRVLLIVPWAIPNYITAIIWRGMFHKQFGAVNAFIETMGGEPTSWFQDFWSAFATNLTTNTWLGFPFMMVVSLGALQSIPSDLYEAATVDGASRWQRFKDITLPLLMPALVPAVIVGTVWTFNMFNVIYLVSGGAPNGATDILITDAFRWAFERDSYGYAAAYSTIIFLILLVFTLITNRITGATKGAFE